MNRKRCARVLPRVACSALLACASSAFAEDVKDTQGPGPADPVITANCDLVDHKVEAQAFSPPATVPDTTSAGVTFGPIVLPADGMFVGHVVMELDCNHSWIGDAGLGCGSNFTTGAVYRFDDTTTGSLPETGCTTGTNIPGGCYRPTGLGAGPLRVAVGGCSYPTTRPRTCSP